MTSSSFVIAPQILSDRHQEPPKPYDVHSRFLFAHRTCLVLFRDIGNTVKYKNDYLSFLAQQPR
ncbi:hypothetical protein GQ53DRAFT_719837 [Thozetella sp. PMI_491]|nr:hypothetical protein GQ53DRAFT_719837 [Thozetella sp. PMI_491]